MFVCMSVPPLDHPARPLAQTSRPLVQPARPEAQPARPEDQPARPEAQPASGLDGWSRGGTDIQTKIKSPHSTGLCLLLGLLPNNKKYKKKRGSVRGLFGQQFSVPH